MINLVKRWLCEYLINGSDSCSHLAKVKINRPNPVEPQSFPKYFCYSHLSTFAKHSNGQFLVTRIESEK